MDSAQKFVNDQVKSLEKVVKGLRDLDRETAMKKVDVDPIPRSLKKLKRRAAELEEARTVALSDIERQMKTVVAQIAALERQSKSGKETEKNIRKTVTANSKSKVTKKKTKSKSKSKSKPSR